MAENILKLKVDSQEYDSKVKRAAEGIQHFVQSVRESGSTLKESGILARSFLQELGNMETVAKGGKQQMRELSNALVTLTDTYRGLSDAEKNSGFGQELNKQIQALTERAGAMKDAMMDVEQSINNAASDTRVFDQLSGGAQLLTASFQAATGAANLLGIEMGDNVEVIAKLQAAMGVVNGLATIQNALQKQSAVMQGVQAVQTAAAAAAQTSYATATGAATVAQKAFNMVANINPYVLLASAVAAVGTALYAFASASSKAKKEAEELKKAEEQAKQAAEQHRQSLVNAASEAGAAAGMIASLRQSYAAANSELEKTQILQQAADQFKKLGIECNGTDDAQRLLVQEGGKVIKMIELQGEAAAIGAMRMEAYKSALASLMSDVESGQLSLSSAMTLANQDSKVSEYTKELAGIQGQMGSLNSSLSKRRGSGSGRTRSTKTAKEDDKYAADSIMAQEKWIAKLEDDWKRAGASVRDEYIPMIEAAKKKLEEMRGVAAAEVDLDKMFPDKSKENYNTGETQSFAQTILGDAAMSEIAAQKDALAATLTEVVKSGVDGADFTAAANALYAALFDPEAGPEEVAEAIAEMNELIPEEDKKIVLDVDTGQIITAAKKVDKEVKAIAAQNDALAATLTEVVKSGVDGADFTAAANALYAALFDPEAGPEEVAEAIAEMNELIPEEDKKIVLDVDTGQIITAAQKVDKEVKAIAASAQAVSTVVGSIGQAFNAIEDPAAKVMGTVMQAIATVAGGYATASAQAADLGPWAWIAFAATGLATMLNMINTIHSSTGYANGGIVKGNSYSGDNIYGGPDAMVNAGELVLTRSQQGNLASQLQDGGLSGLNLNAVISGEDIRLVLKNNGRRTGRGEYITSRNSRS